MIYFIVASYFKPQPEWIENIQAKCPDVDIKAKMVFNDYSILFAALSVIVLAGYYGVFFERVSFGSLWPTMYRTNFSCFALRFMLELLILIPMGLIFISNI